MLKIHRLVPVMLLTALAACERVVDIDLQEGPKRLVVEARLERVKGRASGNQRIRLTTTEPYFSNTEPPAARGAVVRVRDGGGAVYSFVESATEPGIYQTNSLVGEIGQQYTLIIDYLGERYEATERLEAVAPIDTLYFAKPSFVVDSDTGLRATIDLRDPAGVKNFYLWDQFIDGVRVLGSDSTSPGRTVASDELEDGRRVREFQPYDGIVVKPGQEVVIRQIAISEQAYRYYRALSEQASGAGSPLGVPLASLRGNVANISVPEHRALGYFIASEVSEARGQVPAR